MSSKELEIIVQEEQIEEQQQPLPCQILELMTGCLEVVFTPKTEGKHSIQVYIEQEKERTKVAEKTCAVTPSPNRGSQQGGEGREGGGDLELELLGEGKGEAVLGEKAWFIVLFRNSCSKKIYSLDDKFLEGVEVVVANVGSKKALELEEERLEDGSSKFFYTPDSTEGIFLYILKEGEVCAVVLILILIIYFA